jgi:hypothetical protein
MEEQKLLGDFSSALGRISLRWRERNRRVASAAESRSPRAPFQGLVMMTPRRFRENERIG